MYSKGSMLVMVINRKRGFVFAIGVVLVSCGGPKTVSIDELKGFIQEPEHGLIQTIAMNGITLEVLYRPKDFVIAQDIDSDEEKEWLKAREKLDSLDYFVLKISRSGEEVQNKFAGNQSRFDNAINYLSNGIQEDVSIVEDGGKVFEAESTSFAPTFGISDGTRVLLVFKTFLQEDPRDFIITFDDGMFGSGRSEFRFEGDNIEKVPIVARQFD